MWIFIENSRQSLNEKELKESLQLVGVKPELIDEINTKCNECINLIKTYLKTTKIIDTLAYDDLEWRLDVKVASRSLNKCIEPEIIMKLNLADHLLQKQVHLIQTDPNNLINLTNKLEDALNEIKTNYSRRVMSHIK
jgi:COMM domain containing 2